MDSFKNLYFTWHEAFKRLADMASDSGYVISAAKSNPTGRYPAKKKLKEIQFLRKIEHNDIEHKWLMNEECLTYPRKPKNRNCTHMAVAIIISRE